MSSRPRGSEAAAEYLIVYATGLRDVSFLTPVVTLGGATLQVSWAGPLASYPGLYQLNVLVPPTLAPLIGPSRLPMTIAIEDYVSNVADVCM